jgi:hypothetical protein
MKHKSPFVISDFTNPSGNIVFQLYASLDGKRFRNNFPTRAEAKRQVQEVHWLQRETGIRAAATRSTDEQLHEAESVFRRVAGQLFVEQAQGEPASVHMSQGPGFFRKMMKIK